MKLLCSSSSLAFVHSLRIALEGDGIEVYFSDADSTLSSIAGPMMGSTARIYVLHEEDWERAVAIMKDLSGPSRAREAWHSAKKPMPAWVLIAATAILVGRHYARRHRTAAMPLPADFTRDSMP
jgi:hypothetical protein